MNKYICPIHNQDEYNCIQEDGKIYHVKRHSIVDQAGYENKIFSKLGWAVPKGIITNKTPPKKKRK